MDNSFTPYDDAWRTLISEARVTLIPLINEMFKDSGIHYKGDEKIELLNDDIFLPRKDGEQSKRIVDSAFTVDDGEIVRKFHIECQSTTDGTMMVRMFEYDAQIALNDARCRKTGGDLYIRFPASGILYLRSTANTPDHPTITIEVPSGEKVTYSIPALKISDYSAEDIRNKDLFLMIPFYVFKFEKYFTQMEKQGAGATKQLISELNSLCATLNDAVSIGKITELDVMVISDMFKKVWDHLASNHRNVRKEISDSMYGTVLDCPTVKAYKLGGKIGDARRLVRSVEKIMGKYHISLEEACDGCDATVDEYEAAQTLLENNKDFKPED